MKIKNTIAVVSGASSGLGAAIAGWLTAKGAKTYGLARNEKKLKAVRAKLNDNFVPVPLDITEEAAVQQWVKNTFHQKQHRPDILINNAGTGFLNPFGEMTSEQWHAMIETNLNGLYYLTAAMVPLMQQNTGSSHIVNIGSILGKIATAKSAGYSATKFAIQGFSEALVKSLRNDGIKVTCVNPGSISTPFFEDSGIEPHDNMLHPEDIAALIGHILETPDNMLVDQITLRPLQPRKKSNPKPAEAGTATSHTTGDVEPQKPQREVPAGKINKAGKTQGNQKKSKVDVT